MAKKQEIEKEYGDKILNSQLERKGTGLVDMDKNLVSEDMSNMVSTGTDMKVMSSPIKAGTSNIDTQRVNSIMSNTGRIEDRLSPVPAEINDSMSHLTG